MKHFDASAIKQGQANQAASAETPEAFGTMDGAVVPREGPELSSASQRMAGQVGARALSMMNNPEEIANRCREVANSDLSGRRCTATTDDSLIS